MLLLVVYNACKSSPCMNGGRCTKIDQGYECTCSGYFDGTNCKREFFDGYKKAMLFNNTIN